MSIDKKKQRDSDFVFVLQLLFCWGLMAGSWEQIIGRCPYFLFKLLSNRKIRFIPDVNESEME